MTHVLIPRTQERVTLRGKGDLAWGDDPGLPGGAVSSQGPCKGDTEGSARAEAERGVTGRRATG